jgi:hypothetical protein
VPWEQINKKVKAPELRLTTWQIPATMIFNNQRVSNFKGGNLDD